MSLQPNTYLKAEQGKGKLNEIKITIVRDEIISTFINGRISVEELPQREISRIYFCS